MKIKDIITEDVTQSQLDNVERFADSLWGKLGIDVNFTKHFIERINDERNKKPITAAELIRLFKKEYERYGKTIAGLGDSDEAVMKDLLTNINLPFVINDRNNQQQLVAKTVMRKADFKTPNTEFIVK
jgi:hypothetical protein